MWVQAQFTGRYETELVDPCYRTTSTISGHQRPFEEAALLKSYTFSHSHYLSVIHHEVIHSAFFVQTAENSTLMYGVRSKRRTREKVMWVSSGSYQSEDLSPVSKQPSGR